MSSFVERIFGDKEEEEGSGEERRDTEHVHHHHRHHKERHRKPSAKIIKDETPAQTVPQLERKIVTLRDHLEHDLGEKDALLKLIISGIQNLQDSLDVEKNERCDDVDELHNMATKLRLALEQEADARYGVDQSLEAFKEHSDYADLELKSDIEQLQEFQRDTNEDKKIIMGAIMELEEKLNEVRSTHSHQIDDLLINQGQIRKSIEEQIQIIHRIQLSDFENATLKITDIQNKLQEQIQTQAQDFRELTIEANKAMERQRKEMGVIKRQVEDRVEGLGVIVEKKESGLFLKLQQTKERFDKIEASFTEVSTKFSAVNSQVETAINQIHSTRARAEEATDIQKNRFEYFEMFMQSLKQSQATIDSRIGFLYTIVNELRWRERAETQKSQRISRHHSGSAAPADVVSQKSSKSIYSIGSHDSENLENVTQAINDIEMEMKAKLEILTENLEEHRNETLQAIGRARDKSLTSTTAVDKLQTVIDRMNDKFGDIARLEGELVEVKKKFDYTDKKVAHLEGLSESASKNVNVLTRKMWDMFDSDMNLAMFIDHVLKDDKERLWRLEYEQNHLKHMTVGEDVNDDTLPLHIQTSTSQADVDGVKKNISRCLVKSEQLVDDVTNIAKQNDMIRNDMRDLKLLCDYLSSKNDETQRYCRALRKHLDYTNRKLEAYESGKKSPFRFFGKRDDDLYKFDEDLPPLHDERRTPGSPKPASPILNLYMRNKERRGNSPADKIEAMPLKSTQSPLELEPTAPPATPAKLKKKPPPPPSTKTSLSGGACLPACEPSKCCEPGVTETPASSRLEESSVGSRSGFFSNLFNKKADVPGSPQVSERPASEIPELPEPFPADAPDPEKEKGLFDRIFGGKDEEATPSPPPKNLGHLRKKKQAAPKPPAAPKPSAAPKPAVPDKDEEVVEVERIRIESTGHINIPTANDDVKAEYEEAIQVLELQKARVDAIKIDIERGAVAEERARKERESLERLRVHREKQLADREALERAIHREKTEEERRRREESMKAKSERERRLSEATERARAARANEKVIKGELPTWDDWKDEERIRKMSYGQRTRYMEDRERNKREEQIKEIQKTRKRMESEERERREREGNQMTNFLEHEQQRPRHISDEIEKFDEVSPDTAHAQKQEEVAAVRIQSAFRGFKARKKLKEDESSEVSSSEISSEEDSEESAAVAAAPSPPAQEIVPEPEEPEDPWAFDIEVASSASRNSRHNSGSSRSRKKKSIFKRK